MAILNFPANPSVDDTYEENGVLYTWDGVKWAANSTQSFLPITGGELTGDLTVPSLNGGPLAGFRNQIMNGDFRIWQRGTSFTITLVGGADATYMADRWAALDGGTHSRTDVVPAGFTYGITTDSKVGLRQYVELDEVGKNGRFAVGTTWTVSVWATADLPSSARTAPIFRGDDGSKSGSTNTAIATVANWVSTGETSNGYTRYSSKVTITGNVGSTNKSVLVYVEIPASSSCTGIQLEPGPVATPFEHRPYGTELALCQRYYYQIRLKEGDYQGVVGLSNAAYTMPGRIHYPVTMRSDPFVIPVTTFTNALYHNAGAGTAASTTDLSVTSRPGGKYAVYGTTTGVAFTGTRQYYVPDTTIGFNAEL